MTYSDSTEFLCELMQYAAQGEDVEIPCPKCGKPLLVVATREKASALDIHPGIYCTVSRGHVYRMLELMDRKIPPGENWVDKLQRK